MALVNYKDMVEDAVLKHLEEYYSAASISPVIPLIAPPAGQF